MKVLSDMRGKRILINPVDDYCDLKGELIMAIQKPGTIEYKMPEAMARELLKTRKGDDAKMRPNDYLCKVVNEGFGLMYHCVRVIRY
jgi:hypothetical protein